MVAFSTHNPLLYYPKVRPMVHPPVPNQPTSLISCHVCRASQRLLGGEALLGLKFVPLEERLKPWMEAGLGRGNGESIGGIYFLIGNPHKKGETMENNVVFRPQFGRKRIHGLWEGESAT